MGRGPVEGWVFVGYPDESLRPMLRPGTVRLWEDARSIGKVPGQPVLFLQLRERRAAWIGSGCVSRVEERWKAFGVYVETRTVLTRMLPAVATEPHGSATSGRRPVRSVGEPAGVAWENRTLAARLGMGEFRSRTPFLEEGRDIRLTGSDWSVLCALQPALHDLLPSARPQPNVRPTRAKPWVD